jgi:phospholipid/cholesterol/gamma-HCH transport system substrate-binding protein
MKLPARVNRMRTSWARLRTVPGIRRDVSALLGLLLAGTLVGGYILAHQSANWPWEKNFTFSASFEEAPGINPGNGQEVRIAGVSVGDIREAAMTGDGHAQLTMSIGREHRIYDNATLVLRPKSPLNEMYVEISPGGPPGKPLDDGDHLSVAHTENPVQVDEVLQHLDDRSRLAATSLLSEADAALANAPDALPAGLDAADGTMRSLQPVAEALRTRRTKIAKLVTALSQIATVAGKDDVRLARLATSVQQSLRVLATHDRQLDATLQQLPGTTRALRRSTGSVQRLSDQLDPTLKDLDRASAVLPKALRRLTSTVDEAGKVIETAGPVARKARPLINDLRPFVAHLNPALSDLRSVTQRLDPATATLVRYLPDLQAFVYQTNSVVSLEDANGGILRGLLEFSPQTLPLDLDRTQ